MSLDNQGPQTNISLEQFTQSTMRSAQAGGRLESAKSFDDLINQILEGPVRWFSKMTGVNVTNIGSISAVVDFSKAGLNFINDAMNKGAVNFSGQGGAVFRELSVVANKENMFAGVTHAPIETLPVEAMSQVNDIRSSMGEGMPVTAMSYGDLGNLTPMAGGGRMGGPEMSMMS